MQANTGKQAPLHVANEAFAALRAQDLARFSALAAEDVVDDVVAVGELRGRTAVVAFFEELFAAVPDFSLEAESVIANDSGAAVKWRATGTFSGGPFQGVSANGRRIDLRGIDFMEVEDGRIVRNRVAYDGAGFARQIGLLPPERSLPDRVLLTAFNTKTRLVALWRGRTRARERR